jgi:homoserine kinase
MTKQILQEVRVFSPATVANVACGFDVLGFAIELPGDEIIVRSSSQPGFRITKITGDDGRLPLDPKLNTAGVAALDLLRHLGRADLGIEMEIHKQMPFGSGLGSSAASAVGGAFAVSSSRSWSLAKPPRMALGMRTMSGLACSVVSR